MVCVFVKFKTEKLRAKHIFDKCMIASLLWNYEKLHAKNIFDKCMIASLLWNYV
jgi:hypothetical protein